MGEQYQQQFSSPLFPSSQHSEHSPVATSFQSLEPGEKLRALQEIQQLKDKVTRFALKYNALQRENESLRSRIQPLEAKAQMVEQLKEHLQDVKTKLSVEQRKRLALQASLVQSRERRWGQPYGKPSQDGREERAASVASVVAASDAIASGNGLEQRSSPTSSPLTSQHHPLVAGREGAEADVEAFRAAAAAHLEAAKAARREQSKNNGSRDHHRRERQLRQQNVDSIEQSSNSKSSKDPPREFLREVGIGEVDDTVPPGNMSRREVSRIIGSEADTGSSPSARREYGWMKQPR